VLVSACSESPQVFKALQFSPECLFGFSPKVCSGKAVTHFMNTTNPTASAFQNLVIAADETLHVLCRMRGITLDDLSEEALERFFFEALDEEFWNAAR